MNIQGKEDYSFIHIQGKGDDSLIHIQEDGEQYKRFFTYQQPLRISLSFRYPLTCRSMGMQLIFYE